MVLIVFSDGWGNQFGGINTFNYSLCTALKKYIADKETKSVGLIVVTCGVTDKIKHEFISNRMSMLNMAKEDFDDADGLVKLIQQEIASFELIDEEIKEIYCCGHDIFTGPVAEICAEKLNGKSVIFHHMAYKEYYGEIAKTEQDILKKLSKQNDVLSRANIVLGVGPKLEKSAKSIVGKASSKLKPIVKCIIPGFDGIDTGVIDENQFTIFFSGRIEYDKNSSNNTIKQFDLVIRAFCELLRDKQLPNNSQLIICGASSEEAKKHIDDLKTEITDKVAPILAFSYLEHEQLIDLLRGANVAVMPSYDEGFGLTGLEAIVAGVPLILSKNSGLYQFLKDRSLTNSVKSIEVSGTNLESVNELKNNIIKIHSEENSCRLAAEELKDKLSEFSWKNIVERLLKFLSYSKYYRTTEEEFLSALEDSILFGKGII